MSYRYEIVQEGSRYRVKRIHTWYDNIGFNCKILFSKSFKIKPDFSIISPRELI